MLTTDKMRGSVVIWDKDEYMKRQQRYCGLRPDALRGLLWLGLCILGAAAVITYICGPAPDHVAKISQLPQLQQLSQLVANLTQHLPPPPPTQSPRQPYNFTGFDNDTGSAGGDLLVPNVVHLVLSRGAGGAGDAMSFMDLVVLLAAFRNQRPALLLVHTDCAPELLRSRHWRSVLATPGLREAVRLEPLDPLASPAAARIRILMQHGGALLERDAYLVRSLDPLRRYEAAVHWPQGGSLHTKVLVAHPDARFLKLWLALETGRAPSPAELPAALVTREVLSARPELVHRAPELGAARPAADLYSPGPPGPLWSWREQLVVSLVSGLDGPLRQRAEQLNETSCLYPATAFRDMVLDVLDPVTGVGRVQ